MQTTSRAALLLLACTCALLCFVRPTAAVAQTVVVGKQPLALVVNTVTNKVYVANSGSNNVTVIDGASNLTASVPTGVSPSAVAVNEVTNKVYVANAGSNTVTIIDGATKATNTVPVGSDPTSVAVNPVTNEIYVANLYGASVTVIHGATGLTDTVKVGSYPCAVAVNPVTNKIYVANEADNTVTVIDGATHATTAVPTGSTPWALALNSVADKIYVANYAGGTLTRIDGSTNATSSIVAGPSPAAVAVNAASNKIYVANGVSQGTVTVIDGTTGYTAAVPAGAYTYSLALNAVTGTVYAANYSSNNLTILTNTSRGAATVQAGRSPRAVAVNSATNKTYVANYSDGTVTVLGGAAFTPLQYVPVTPCRAADTRWTKGPLGGPSVSGQSSRDFPIASSACGIPATAAAFALNVTVVPHGSLGYLTLWPSGSSQPTVSTLNSVDGRVKATAAIVPAGTNGGVSVLVSMDPSATTDVVLDINGYFVTSNVSQGLMFFPVTPCRLLDTRTANGPLGGPSMKSQETRTIPVLRSNCNLLASAQAYSLNFTAIPKGPLGYLTAWPADKPKPGVSTLNAVTGTITANAAIVPADQNGDIDVFVTNDTDLAVDVNGYFAPANAGPNPLSLYTVDPCRMLDTRKSRGSFAGVLAPAANPSNSGCDIPTSAQAIVLNATAIPSGSLGYLTLWPDGGTRPLVSTLNAVDGSITSNMAIVPMIDGLIDAYGATITGTLNLVLDTSGYFAP